MNSSRIQLSHILLVLLLMSFVSLYLSYKRTIVDKNFEAFYSEEL
jgi:hypothetical protein